MKNMADLALKIAIESRALQTPKLAYAYAYLIMEDRWPKAESLILTDPKYAWLYARDIIEARWPEAEPIIKTNLKCAYSYARDVLKFDEEKATLWANGGL